MCSVDQVKQLYFAGIPEINPNRIVPIGPEIDYSQP
jgi:putative glutathione S-transferase